MTNPTEIRDILNTLERLNESASDDILDALKRTKYKDAVRETGTTVVVYVPSAERKETLQSILLLLPGSVHNKAMAGSSLGGIEYMGGKILIKPAEFQGKEAIKIKPTEIGLSEAETINSNSLAAMIINNKELKSSPTGKVVIKIAATLNAGQTQIDPKVFDGLPDKALTEISKSAGEYLGILALIKGLAENQADFNKLLKFLNVSGSLAGKKLSFPNSQTSQLADSYALDINETGSRLMISSKDLKGGAAPSLSGLFDPEKAVLPTTITKRFPEFSSFLADSVKRSSIKNQPMDMLRWAKTNGRMAKLPKIYKSIDIDKLFSCVFATIQNDTQKKLIPKDYKDAMDNIISSYPDVEASENPYGAKAFYSIKKDIIVAINNNDLVPHLKDAVLEILGHNFVQVQFGVNKSGKIKTEIIWPNKPNAKSSIVVFSKDASTAGGVLKNMMGFKIVPPASAVDDETDAALEPVKKVSAKAVAKDTAKKVKNVINPDLDIAPPGSIRKKKKVAEPEGGRQRR